MYQYTSISVSQHSTAYFIKGATCFPGKFHFTKAFKKKTKKHLFLENWHVLNSSLHFTLCICGATEHHAKELTIRAVLVLQGEQR